MNRVRRPGQAEFIQVLRQVNIEKIQYLISSNVSCDIESALFKGQVDQKVKSNQLVRDFKLKYNFGMIKNEILPSQKNDVLDGRRYAFLGIFGIVLTWRIFQDHKKIKKNFYPQYPTDVTLTKFIFRRVLENTLRMTSVGYWKILYGQQNMSNTIHAKLKNIEKYFVSGFSINALL